MEADMKTLSAVCAALLGTAVLTGGTALADSRCPPGEAAAGLCAPLHFVDDDRRSQMLRGAYRRGYEDARRGYDPDEFVPRPRALALDGKEGYSQDYRTHRRYKERDRYARDAFDDDDFRRRIDRDNYRRRIDRDDYRRRMDGDDYRRRMDRDDYARSRRYDDDDYYERRLRQDDAGEAVNMATELFRRALSN
jgi:hypothetical protein